jgi:hypothetical protein
MRYAFTINLLYYTLKILMPIKYKYDPDSKIIHTVASGVIKTKDLTAYMNSVLEDKDIERGFVEIADFESVKDLVVTYSDMSQFPFVWGKYMEKGCKAVLIYAPSNLSYGIFRMLQTVISLRHKSADDLFIVLRTKEEIEKTLHDLIPS